MTCVLTHSGKMFNFKVPNLLRYEELLEGAFHQ